MATLAAKHDDSARGERFFSTLAIIMGLTVVIGFTVQFLAGRSSLASPLRVHAHGVLFMGWVAIFVAQARFATHGPIALHRRLGWLAMGWIAAMLVTAMVVILAMVRNGTVPFFFQPQHFLFADPLTLVCFVALTALAVRKRKDTDWHARLQIGAMALLTGPAFGRLLPMPLLIPYAFEAAGVAASVFIFAGMIRDKRVVGTIHPAWYWGLAMLYGLMLVAWLLAPTAFGDWLYQTTVAGHPGAAIPGMEFAAPPQAP